jgi:CubicO group peptidase (beta-lactamase class C family)
MGSSSAFSRRWKRWQLILAALALLAAGLVVFYPKPPLPPSSITSVAELDAYLNKLTRFGTPQGLTLVVTKNGKTLYSKGFGMADRPRNIPASPETVYHWWSITKIPTAIAILQLQEQGKLRLDDPVVKYLSFFKVEYPSARSQVITIRHLLNHSSGIPDAGLPIITWVHHEGEPALNQTALLERLLPKYSKLAFEPGAYTQYTNIGYMVLGAIIEGVSGQSYEAYIREHLLEPLRMTHTDFLYTKAMEPNEAAGGHPVYDYTAPLVPFLAASYVREISGSHILFKRVYNDQTPPTGLIGSALDAARLATAYMNGGEFDGERILSPESVALMSHESYMKGKGAEPAYYVRQGLGWQVYQSRGGMMLRHEGGGLGFSTSMQLYPDEKLSFVLFSNDTKCECWRIMNLVASLKW